ncbi:hypothetical protein [Maribellus maritimus]|nr:hypothetical protein [Maribellus maritimus]MCG6186314.1 hypothetical protein [Maribellus maritimus]
MKQKKMDNGSGKLLWGLLPRGKLNDDVPEFPFCVWGAYYFWFLSDIM